MFATSETKRQMSVQMSVLWHHVKTRCQSSFQRTYVCTLGVLVLLSDQRTLLLVSSGNGPTFTMILLRHRLRFVTVTPDRYLLSLYTLACGGSFTCCCRFISAQSLFAYSVLHLHLHQVRARETNLVHTNIRGCGRVHRWCFTYFTSSASASAAEPRQTFRAHASMCWFDLDVLQTSTHPSDF